MSTLWRTAKKKSDNGASQKLQDELLLSRPFGFLIELRQTDNAYELLLIYANLRCKNDKNDILKWLKVSFTEIYRD